ncbi:MAG: hypothetical protein CM1200mP12_23460 [Gammaproteobacteria bacterium]|nr:MAG: hypothetical protein CM1200mP12_23460 [Gammaproteobacteria bacterium]
MEAEPKAVTIVPAMADDVEHITMLQRSPTYFMAAPDKDMIGNFFKRIFPQKTAYFLTRWKNILMGNFFYNRFIKNPEKVKEMLINGVRDHLGKDYDIETILLPDINLGMKGYALFLMLISLKQ